MEALRRAMLYRNRGRTALKRNAVVAKPQLSFPNTRRVQRVGGQKERSREDMCKNKNGTLMAFMSGYCKEFGSLNKIIWLAHGLLTQNMKAMAFSTGQFGL